jgi:hypothetical protein
MATAGIWMSIPCPKNLNPKIIKGRSQTILTNVIDRQSRLNEIMTTFMFKVILYLSIYPPKISMAIADAKVPPE